MSSFFRLIGDVHGYLHDYVQVASSAYCSLQVGDLTTDINENVVHLMSQLDPNYHRYIGGNHDDYFLIETDLGLNDSRVSDPTKPYTIVGPGRNDFIEKFQETKELKVYKFGNVTPHFLGNYGVWKLPKTQTDIFFVRGAWSIDGEVRRNLGYTWYPREQLSWAEAEKALAFYESVKPDFVVTHSVPFGILPHLELMGEVTPNLTNRLLNFMLESHKPKMWFFGHFHQQFFQEIYGVEFVGLNQFPGDGWTFDFDEHMNPLGFDRGVW